MAQLVAIFAEVVAKEEPSFGTCYNFYTISKKLILTDQFSVSELTSEVLKRFENFTADSNLIVMQNSDKNRKVEWRIFYSQIGTKF